MDISDKFYGAGEFLMRTVRDTVTQHEENAVYEERIMGLHRMTAALYEARVDDNEIIRLIQKYYEISFSDAEEVLRNEKWIMHPCRLLEEYLKREQGYSKQEAVNYIIYHNTENKLQEKPELSKYNGKELYNYLESNGN